MKEEQLLKFDFNATLLPTLELEGHVKFECIDRVPDVWFAFAAAEDGLFDWYNNQTEEAQRIIKTGILAVFKDIPAPDKSITGKMEIKATRFVDNDGDNSIRTEVHAGLRGFILCLCAIKAGGVFNDAHPMAAVILSTAKKILENA